MILSTPSPGNMAQLFIFSNQKRLFPRKWDRASFASGNAAAIYGRDRQDGRDGYNAEEMAGWQKKLKVLFSVKAIPWLLVS